MERKAEQLGKCCGVRSTALLSAVALQQYNNTSAHEQSVYELSAIPDAHTEV